MNENTQLLKKKVCNLQVLILQGNSEANIQNTRLEAMVIKMISYNVGQLTKVSSMRGHKNVLFCCSCTEKKKKKKERQRKLASRIFLERFRIYRF